MRLELRTEKRVLIERRIKPFRRLIDDANGEFGAQLTKLLGPFRLTLPRRINGRS
jgi:hypothetical protein